MYANLKAEMARSNIKVVDLASATGRAEKTIRSKLAGDYDWTIGEASAIRSRFFPSMSVDYLFENNKKE
jgi:hypothetical protein